jgi:uncharacterized protein (DUF1330 family)
LIGRSSSPERSSSPAAVTKILVNYGRYEVLEGDTIEGIVIAEFPSFEAAKAWYESPAYQAIRHHRLKGAIYDGLVVQGV